MTDRERVTIGTLHHRVKALEERLAKLEAPPPVTSGRYEQRQPLEIIPITGLFTVESRGPKWFCMSPEGVKVNERGCTKDEAQELADQMNGVTKSMRAA